ncbi:response regulator transcription factor [Phragmitibacter flavus]|uniref:Response regulator transcription factor n=1 Tax=Phragmitibacter flavus TaxID=2576071 RepID=A0A5R8KK35_9BACT|nr:response regulator transcription factor [Phragmitibacter flavus]TLD72684.1 response regulator transcription factor [Phragmitibacter flavus]
MKILIAEDDQHTRAALCEVLRGEGYTTIDAPDGRAALELFHQHQPDFICLDVMMPHLDGYEVCRQVRRKNAQVPVLFLTAKAEEIDKVLGLELGADDYMAKPFGVREILARIRAITRRTGLLQKIDGMEQPFTMEDLRIEPAELRAYRDTTEIPLSLREVKILRLLWQRRGKVVDRDTLTDEAWGADYFPESRAVDQQISQLRKRVEQDPAHPRLIRTIHGAGYRFE